MLAKKPDLRGKPLYEVLYAPPEVSKFPLSELAEDQLDDESRELGYSLQKGLIEEYAWCGRGHGHAVYYTNLTVPANEAGACEAGCTHHAKKRARTRTRSPVDR